MPRKRKTNMPAIPYPGAQYGQGQDQVAALKQQPLQNNVNATQNVLDQAAQSQGQGGPQGAPPPQPGLDFASALQQAQQMQPGSAIHEFADPNQPMTAGLPTGPGPGPEAVQVPNQANLFRTLAEATGDPNFLRMAVMTKMDQ